MKRLQPHPYLKDQLMFNQIRNIVEVHILDAMNRPKKKRILGVWGETQTIPFDLIRSLNEKKYPGCGVEIKVHVYEGP
jgi:hypothetical protein